MKITVLLHLCFGFCYGASVLQSNGDENLVHCKTFNETSGECIDIQNCPLLLALSNQKPLSLENTYTLILSDCGVPGNSKVCCDKEDDAIHFVDETSAERRFLGRRGSQTTHCPGNQKCIPTRDCHYLVEHLKNYTYTIYQRDFFREMGCGFEGTDPMVCCTGEPIEFFLDNIPTEPIKSNLLPNTSECGLSIVDRIVGGRVAEIAEFPWMALLEYTSPTHSGKEFNCGGSLISKRYVLTAGHCITELLISVRLGEYDLNKSKDCDYCEDPIDVAIEEKIFHKDFVDHPNDIGLIRLSREVKPTDYIRPICLPTTPDLFRKTYIGINMTVAGWGITENGTTSNLLRKLDVPMKMTSECSNLYGYKAKIPLALFCAGGIRGDSCQGDSGGPLMISEQANIYSVGIVSFGTQKCGLANWPAVYTKVAYYMQWIVDNLKP